jgi:polar amino acid transport system ATP-binding protein
MRLELDQLSLSFGTHTVLDGLSTVVPDVQSLVLLGPSGGGKSTLLRVIGGLLRPDAGTVRLNGAELPQEETALIQHRRRIGMVFQSYNLFLHLSALENLLLPLTRVHGLSEAVARKRAELLLERFHLTEHAHKKPRELSGGQQQRIALLRAVAIEPDLLLLDEPTSSLDPEMAMEVCALIVELRAQGLPLILVTHQMRFARKIADRVLFLEQGQPLVNAAAIDFFTDPPSPTTARYVAGLMDF